MSEPPVGGYDNLNDDLGEGAEVSVGCFVISAFVWVLGGPFIPTAVIILILVLVYKGIQDRKSNRPKRPP